MTWSSDRGRFPRFLALAVANTVATYLLYLLLLQFTVYAVAYTISYVAGIALSYAANALLVFRSGLSVKTAAAYPLVYVFQYAAGLGIIAVLIEVAAVPEWLAPWIAAAVLLPASFLLTRFILKPKVPDAASDHQ